MSYGAQVVEVGIDPTSEQPQGTLPAAPALMGKLVLDGTTDTGETLALGDIADSLIIKRGGTTFIQASFEFFSEFNQAVLGDVDEPSGNANAAERVVAYIPFFHPDWPQIIEVTPQDYNYQLNFNTGTLGTRFGTNTVTVDFHLITASGLDEIYTPRYVADNVDVRDAAGLTESYPEPNIVSLYFRENNGANLTDITIEQDDQTLVSNQDLQGLDDQQRLLRAFAQDETNPVFSEWNALDSLRDVSVFSSRTDIEYDADAGGDLDVIRVALGRPEGDQISRERLAAAQQQSIRR